MNLEPYKAYALYTFVDIERFNIEKIGTEKTMLLLNWLLLELCGFKKLSLHHQCHGIDKR